MGYRKFKADHLFAGTGLQDANNILITDENGIVENIVEEKDAGDDIETFEGIISPGFINCHCHLELSHMKNVIESGTGLIDFLIKVVSLRGALKEEMEAAIQNADNEMFEGGIVAVGDISNTTDSLQTKVKSKIIYRNFIEVLGFSEENAKNALEPYVIVYKDFCAAGLEKNTSIVPHAPYTISRTMFGLINDLSKHKIISIHNQETLAEDELYQTKTGDFFRLYHHLNINTDFFQPYKTSSLQSYLPLLDKPKQILLIHNTFTTQADIEFAHRQSAINNQKLFWCLCANANLYIENKLPPVELFRKNNCSIVLGTDSYSSNWSLNILDEMKTIQKNFPSLKAAELLQWSTINGAKALGFDDVFGSFEKGKKPGVVLINNIYNNKLTEHSAAKRIL
ncbi:MAG: amidohydrolase family protein [Parafilimonas sp.]|nr:amidohydrolase family protein [Parafilimonas sp.]